MQITKASIGQHYRLKKVVRHSYSEDLPPDGVLVKPIPSGGSGYSYITNLVESKNFVVANETEVEPVSQDELRAALDAIIATPSAENMPLKWGHETGSDPEIFVVDAEGELIPAYEFLPSERNALNLAVNSGYYGARTAFYDGMQAEFTICHGPCHAHTVDYIQRGLTAILDNARKHNKDAKLCWSCVKDLPPPVFTKATKEQLALGCAPSENVYGAKGDLEDLNPATLPFRFAGFHFHCSLSERNNPGLFTRVIKAMDAIAGVASVSLLRGMEDIRRRKYYGLAGEYRTPPHGLEWRVLSSAVLAHPIITHLMLDLTRYAGTLAEGGYERMWKVDEAEVQAIINSLDVRGAEEVLNRNMGAFEAILQAIYGRAKRPHFYKKVGAYTNDLIKKGGPYVWENAKTLFMDGASKWLPLEDMSANWLIGVKGENAWRGHSESANRSVYRLILDN
jgi:hypothetical protein